MLLLWAIVGCGVTCWDVNWEAEGWQGCEPAEQCCDEGDCEIVSSEGKSWACSEGEHAANCNGAAEEAGRDLCDSRLDGDTGL